MKIFVSIRVPQAGDGRREILAGAEQAIRAAGHEPFIAYQEIIRNGLKDSRDFMPFVRQHIRDADLFLALYDPELRGGLIELGIAYAIGVPVWLCRRRGARASSSAIGCAEQVIEYSDPGELAQKLSQQLGSQEKTNL